MTPEPTPVSGMIPLDVSTLPLTVMRTTAGLALAATLIVADDSSMVTGWLLAPTFVTVGVLDTGAGRSSAPVALRATSVPPDASTADRIAAPRTVPRPLRPLRVPLTVPWVTGAGETASAGSYQRSGVGGVGWAGSS